MMTSPARDGQLVRARYNYNAFVSISKLCLKLIVAKQSQKKKGSRTASFSPQGQIVILDSARIHFAPSSCLISSPVFPFYLSALTNIISPRHMRNCSILRRRLHSSANLTSLRAQIPVRLPRSSTLARHYSTRAQPREASSFWSVTFALLAVTGGAWLHNIYFNPTQQQLPAPSRIPPQEPFLGVIDTLKTMPTEPAPGTIGTLTPEQEAKLQEFWILTLKVFGVKLDALEAEAANGNGNSEAAPATPAKEKKSPPKRRWGLWGRSSDDDDDAKSVASAKGITSNLASINITDGDDKYGQSKEFQQALEQLEPEEIRTAYWNMVKQDNPDSLLLRFLRARKWDVQKALIMMISTMRWRLQEVHVDDDIMANGEALALENSKSSDPAKKKKGEEFLHQMRMGKSFLHGVDRFGRPICVVRVRLHKAGDQEADTLERFTVYTIETARMLLAPPVETAVCPFL